MKIPFQAKLGFYKLALIGLLLSSNLASAEQSQTFGDYTVHYISVNSTFLDPEIAQQYKIKRSKRRAFLNISVLKNESDGSTTPVTAVISGTKKNLLQQTQNLDFVKVTEGDAIYYIGQFEFSNAENSKFELELQPESQGRRYSLEWSTKLYNN